MPGWLLTVSIWGYDSGATVLSQCFTVAVNATLYGMVVVFLLKAARSFGSRNNSREVPRFAPVFIRHSLNAFAAIVDVAGDYAQNRSVMSVMIA